MAMDVDFTGMEPDDVEAGGAVAPGWYRCQVQETKDNQHTPGNLDVEFVVTHGPYKGCRIYDTLVDPNNARDTDAAKKCRNRLAMYLTRLGLMTKEELAGKNLSIDWTELVGREALVQVKEDAWTTAEGEKKSRCKVTFDGVHGIDGEKVPEDVKKKLGVPVKAKGKEEGGADTTVIGKLKPPQGGTGAVSPPDKKKVDKSRL